MLTPVIPSRRSGDVLETWNGEAVEVSAIPMVPVARFRALVLGVLKAGGRLSALFGREEDGGVVATAVLADDPEGRLGLLSARVGASYPALSSEAPAAQAFERELAEQFGVVPEGHPWLKPLRFEPPRRAGPDAFGRKDPRATIPASTPSSRWRARRSTRSRSAPCTPASSSPGTSDSSATASTCSTSRFVLGYQHRGVEALLRGGPGRRSVALAESIAGDTAIGHGLAYVKAIESLAGDDAAGARPGAPRRRPRARAGREPRRRPRRARERRRASSRPPPTAARCGPTS